MEDSHEGLRSSVAELNQTICAASASGGTATSFHRSLRPNIVTETRQSPVGCGADTVFCSMIADMFDHMNVQAV